MVPAGLQNFEELCARINDSDSEGRTALFHASENGHSKIISLLVKNGANPNAVSVQNRTPLMQATVNQHLEGMEILLNYGSEYWKRCMVILVNETNFRIRYVDRRHEKL